MPYEKAADIATIIASIIGGGALIVAAYQLRRSAKISEGQFLLELEKMLSTHDEVHMKLRPGGEWTQNQSGPSSVEEWAKIEDYMGFFEHCELLIQDGSLCSSRFNNIFGYRVHNIVDNQKIVNAKLESKERDSWILFLKLCERI